MESTPSAQSSTHITGNLTTLPNPTTIEKNTEVMATPVNFATTPAPDDAAFIILPVFYCIIGALGILGNGTVMVVFYANRKIFRSITNMLILNQSVMDFVVSIIFLLDRIGPDLYPLTVNPVLGEILCRIWDSEYILWALYIATTQNLVLVSLERYYATCHPVFHRNNFTTRGAKFSIAGVWIFGLIYQCYWIFVYYFEFTSGSCYPNWANPTLQAVAGTIVFLVEYFIPLIVMTFSYVNIILMLKKRGQGKTGGVFQRAKRNVTITLCLVFVSFVICWTPTEFGYLSYNWGRSYDFDGTFHYSATVLVLCNMCTAPFIYTFKYEQFQNHLKRMFLSCPESNFVDADTGSGSGIARKPPIGTRGNRKDEPDSHMASTSSV